MRTEIFYFSGTGNSLIVARNIAKKTNGRLIPIASLTDMKSIQTDADAIGIVFPVYFVFNGGIPLIIERFVGKLTNLSTKYIFAICTCYMGAGDVFINLSKMLKKRGGKLSGGFVLKMPYNYTFISDSLSYITNERKQKMIDECKRKLEDITEYIKEQKEGKFERNLRIILFLLRLSGIGEKLGKGHYQKKAKIYKATSLPFSEILPLMDKSFQWDDDCNGCEICSKVCPVNNIHMENNKPLWLHSCEQCFACLQWCPKNAIQFGAKTKNGQRYHHPDVNINDMMNQKRVTP